MNIKINHCTASPTGETDVKISQLALEKKGIERPNTFEHDPDFYLFPLDNIR